MDYSGESTHRSAGFSPLPRGLDLLSNPLLNKGTAFTERERQVLGLRGLLPARVDTLSEQVARVLENYRAKPNDLERYIFLTALHDRNQTLFYRVLADYIEQMMPIVYTPTVGKACQRYGHIFRRPRGLFLSPLDRGRMRELLDHWPQDDVRVIVVTDGQRILGLGDLGASGMGIPVGKLALYTCCAGVDPAYSLPVMLDVGTDNQELLEDPLYLGIRRQRCRGHEYEAVVDEFVHAATDRFPGVLIQFEDFATSNAWSLLERYRDQICTFNDDIQGTGAVVLAGLYSACETTGRPLQDQRILFVGAGAAATGTGLLLGATARRAQGTDSGTEEHWWLIDSRGLVVKKRQDLEPHKLAFARDIDPLPTVMAAIERLQPTALIGASGQPGIFTREILEKMAEINDRPIVFALSNPTSKAECTAEQAYRWTNGRALFASGSPFAPVELGGQRYQPGQGNNAYIFPGVGLGVLASGARRVSTEMFLAAARTLAQQTDKADRERGCLYPPLARIRDVSAAIAEAVANVAFQQGSATVPEPEDMARYVRSEMYVPDYRSYV